ncbi:hypothetical protein BH11ARM1_BH11ARM1_11200 [soil metagenome]
MQTYSEELTKDVESLTAEIYAAFDGVTREGGMSWRDAQIEDAYGLEENASYIDTDTRWQDLIDDPAWYHEFGIGGFVFLDPIGFRYYFAPAMIRSLRQGDSETLDYQLRSRRTETGDDEWTLRKFSAFNLRQNCCTAKFVELMNRVDDEVYRAECIARGLAYNPTDDPSIPKIPVHWMQFLD